MLDKMYIRCYTVSTKAIGALCLILHKKEMFPIRTDECFIKRASFFIGDISGELPSSESIATLTAQAGKEVNFTKCRKGPICPLIMKGNGPNSFGRSIMSNSVASTQTTGFKSHLRPQAPRPLKPQLTLTELLALPGVQMVKIGGAARDESGREYHVRAEFLGADSRSLWAIGSVLEIPIDQLKKLAPEIIGRAGGFYSHQGLTGSDGLLNRGWEYSVTSRERVGGDNWAVTVQFHVPSGFRVEVRDLDARTLPPGMEIPGWLRFALRSRPPIPARPGKTERDRERGAAQRSADARAKRSAATLACKGASGGGGNKGGKGK